MKGGSGKSHRSLGKMKEPIIFLNGGRPLPRRSIGNRRGAPPSTLGSCQASAGPGGGQAPKSVGARAKRAAAARRVRRSTGTNVWRRRQSVGRTPARSRFFLARGRTQSERKTNSDFPLDPNFRINPSGSWTEAIVPPTDIGSSAQSFCVTRGSLNRGQPREEYLSEIKIDHQACAVNFSFQAK